MTVTTTNARQAWATDGVATVFPVNFKVRQQSDVDLYFVSSLGVITQPLLNTDYTMVIDINYTAEITFLVAPANAGRLVALRDRVLTQETSSIGKEEFSALEVETIADNIVFLLQEVNDKVERSLKLDLTDVDGTGQYDANGNQISNVGASSEPNDVVIRSEVSGLLAADLAASQAAAAAAAASAVAADNSADGADVSEANAAASATTASNAATTATTQATNAGNSATTATTQATNASNSATTATTQATNASNSAIAADTSADAAAVSETNAAASASSAASIYDSFDDRYLGPKAVAPTLDNDGNVLLTGALYFDTVSNLMQTWDGAAWITFQGPQGDPGQGAEWHTDTGAPAGGLGVEGDFYLNANNGDVYEKTGVATWTLVANLEGPPGDPGPGSGDMLGANNLSDVADPADSRFNIGLGNVTNTSDANKPVSIAQQTALDLKANAANPAFTGTATGLTKSMVGLGNADNTSDVDKPVSTAQQTALDLKLDDSQIDTDTALTANSDVKVASQKATKAYVDALIAASDAMVFKGVIDASTNPNYPASDRGHTYRISVAGKVGGASGPNVEIGDILIALTDGTAAGTHAAVGAQWSIVQSNMDGGVIGPASVTDLNPAVFDGATGKLIKQITYAAFKTALVLAKADIAGLGTADSPQFTGLEIGHATDTTLTRSGAGELTVEGNRIFRVGGADVPIADGGTGQSTAAAAFDALSPNTTQGDITIRGAAGNQRLGTGTSGQVLTAGGAGANPSWEAPAGGGAYPPGHIFGLTMSNAADTLNDITIAAGSARSEDNTTDMVLAAAITKRLDAAWAVGTNQGGINTGAEAASTWYEVILIKRTDTNVVDVMFSTTANRATLPTNYTKSRRIGWIRNDAASAILQFTQVDDYITLTTQVGDASAQVTDTAAAVTLTAPPSSIARFRAGLVHDGSGTAQTVTLVFSEIVEGNITPAVGSGRVSLVVAEFAAAEISSDGGHFELRVSSTSTIEHDASSTQATFDISTYGWIDHRRSMSAT